MGRGIKLWNLQLTGVQAGCDSDAVAPILMAKIYLQNRITQGFVTNQWPEGNPKLTFTNMREKVPPTFGK